MFEVIRLVDGVFEIPADSFLYVGDAAEGTRIRAVKGGAGTPVPVNCFLLKGAAAVILIDAGTGTAWGSGLGHARAALAAEDIVPDTVDRVLLTHVHGDHALGLFEGDEAYFPRARISVPASDLAFFTDPANRAAAPEARRSVFDIADRLLQVYAGRIDAFEGAAPLPGVVAVPLPGHTPGHTGYQLETPEGGLLLWGDAMHLADAQPRDQRVGLTYDQDPERAFESRRAVLERAADSGLRVGGGHIEGFFRVARDGSGFRLAA
jgi:glyoxylase-like metal-dependent hydrolase (beta-lactamase superfamily II)